MLASSKPTGSTTAPPRKIRKTVHADVSEEELAAESRRLLSERSRLPIASARRRLIEEVRANQVLIAVGETGSGKSTQLPQFLAAEESGLLQAGAQVAVTQPRRVAAVTVAKRVAQEMGTRIGDKVGYAIRFEDCSSSSTVVRFLTDGMLLREALVDPLLRRYGVVVLDEAHERTLHTDVLLGLLKQLLAKREDDFRLIVMSATLDFEKFQAFFPGSKAVYVQGRQYPVSMMYLRTPEEDYLDACLVTALQVHLEEAPGDILMFLTGQDEIESMERLVQERARKLPPTALKLLPVPLFAALPPDQQLEAFKPCPPGCRKLILATNIAETSVTIGGVRYVVDPGLVKARGYEARSGVERLAVAPISQAQARQRAGRAGREAPGKCFRLYTEPTFEGLPLEPVPEIQRTNLANVVLQLKALGVRNVVEFEVMDRPPREALVRSLELLYALGALDDRGELSDPIGLQMSKFPLEPSAARTLIASAALKCTAQALLVLSMLSSELPFYTPKHKESEARAAHGRFAAVDGDHCTLLNVLEAYLATPFKQRASWCSTHFLNHRALKHSEEVHAQLSDHCTSIGIDPTTADEDSTAVRKSLVAGFFFNAAQRQPDGMYRTLSNTQSVKLHPSSVLFGKKPETVLFNELVYTTKLYIRDVSVIETAWLVELAPKFYSSKQGS